VTGSCLRGSFGRGPPCPHGRVVVWSVQEIHIAYSKEAYRITYVTKLADCIHVLHTFHNKSKTGIETPKEEIDFANQRYEQLVQSSRRS
jgi:phage-related protein